MAEREAAGLITIDTSTTTHATTEAQIAEPTDADAVVAAVRTAAVRLPTHKDPHLLARSATGWGERAEPGFKTTPRKLNS